MGDQRPRPHGAASDEPQGLGELVLIDHRAGDRDLATHDREERHRRGLVREPDEHDASARPHQLERMRRPPRACRRSRPRDRRPRGPENRRAASASGPSHGRVRRLGAQLAPRARSAARDRLTTSTRAPRARSTCRASSPSVPAPTIAAALARLAARPRFTARTTTASGSVSSRSSSVGAGRGRPAAPRGHPRRARRSRRPRRCRSWSATRHRLRLPSRQSGQRAARVVRLDDDAIAGANPRSRPAATASTRPTSSWPITRG